MRRTLRSRPDDFLDRGAQNHLSPYYLSRILQQLRKLVTDSSAQAIFSSHAQSVVSRVPPESVRYCHQIGDASTVQAIPMPEDGTEAVKFVRSVMLAFPDLYFARMVILVEGDSERIVLPKLPNLTAALKSYCCIAGYLKFEYAPARKMTSPDAYYKMTSWYNDCPRPKAVVCR